MNCDYIVVGQGIAGTNLCHALQKQNLKVAVIDQGHHKSSSASAAGIVNPVTGRRFVKAWMYDKLREKALEVYGEFEDLLNRKLIFPQPIIRAVSSESENNNLNNRYDKPEYRKYIHALDAPEPIKSRFKTDWGWVSLKKSLQVDIRGLIKDYREILKERDNLIEEEFDIEKIKYHDSHVEYSGLQARGIVFAQGAEGINNPLFDYISYEPSKGQAERIKWEGESLDCIFKGRVFVVPLPDSEEHWVGTINKWDFEHDRPEEEMKTELLAKFKSCFKEKFQCLESLSGVRAGIKDRKPVMGRHPLHPRLFIFNGLGAKGTSFAPFWSERMAEFMGGDSDAIPIEVSSDRFWK
nr:FAD-binding oxidoreductase [Saprospiraceae bacterium]